MTPTAARSSFGPRLLACLFAGSSALALLLFLCSATMWGRGFLVSSDHLWFVAAPRVAVGECIVSAVEVHSQRGLVQLQYLRASVPVDANAPGGGWHWTTVRRGPRALVLGEDELVWGFGVSAGRDAPADGTRLGFARATLPWWFLVSMTAILPAAYIRSRCRLVYRKKHDLCPSCGYDLRATGGRCPECGAAVVGGAKAASPATAA